MKILLVCNAGMSTSLLVEKIEIAAEERNVKAEISAQPVDGIKEHLVEKDVVLLGPQVRFKLKQIESAVSNKIPVGVIDMSAYGTMNGNKILDQAIELTKKK